VFTIGIIGNKASADETESGKLAKKVNIMREEKALQVHVLNRCSYAI